MKWCLTAYEGVAKCFQWLLAKEKSSCSWDEVIITHMLSGLIHSS